MADTAKLDSLWREMGNQGDRPVGWFGPRGAPDDPTYTISDARMRESQAKSLEQRQNALNQATSTYESFKPQVSQMYEGQRQRAEAGKQPLNERYSTLIDEIKGKRESDANTQTTITRNEFGARGLPVSSTMVQQQLADKVGAINKGYASTLRNVELDRTEGLRSIDDLIASLTDKEKSALMDVNSAIAQLQYTGGNAQANDIQNFAQLRSQQAQQEADNLFRQNQQDQLSRIQNSQLSFEQQLQPIQLAKAQLELDKARKPAAASGNWFESPEVKKLINEAIEAKKRLGAATGSVNTGRNFSTGNPNYNPGGSNYFTPMG